MVFSSCVTTKKYNQLNQENIANKERLTSLSMKNTECNQNLISCQKENERLNNLVQANNKDNTANTQLIKSLQKENEELKVQLQSSNKKINEVISDKSEHLTSLSNDLYQKELELNQKEATLDSLQAEFYDNQQKMEKLKKQLADKQQQLSTIQNKLKDALFGFTDKGLTIENKDGKVYVMMDEKLLFGSGSWQVSEQGQRALSEIAVVLANNPDIDIMVEGHTDNVPLKGKNQVKDNWDLSVMRATSITKILLSGTGINPTRIIPCGRSEYMPITSNASSEGRAKNRRSEIILSPKVSEILETIK